MNLRQLEYFVRVAEAGSFSGAARVLGVAQPALSRHVRLLETDLRQVLLLRTGRGVTLTEAGKRLFEHGVGILQLLERAREDVEASREEPLGRIVVGLPPSMGRVLTVALVDAFRKRLPRARLAIVEGLSNHVAEWIATGRVDVGLVYNPEPSEGIETLPVLEEELCLVGPAGSAAPGGPRAPRTLPLPGRRPGPGRRQSPGDDGETATVPFADLGRYPLIIPERLHAIRRQLETRAAQAGVKLQVAWEVSSVPAILELVGKGYGFAVLTRSALASSPAALSLAARPLREPRLTSVLGVAVSASRPATPLVRQTTALLRELALAAVPPGPPEPPERAHPLARLPRQARPARAGRDAPPRGARAPGRRP